MRATLPPPRHRNQNTNTNTHMAKVKPALAELTIEEKTKLAGDVVAAMTGNAALATPNPTLASITAVASAGQSPWSSPVTARAV